MTLQALVLPFVSAAATVRQWWRRWYDGEPVPDEPDFDEIEELVQRPQLPRNPQLPQLPQLPEGLTLPQFHDVEPLDGDDYIHAEEARSTRWHLRATILDRLDEYFACIRRLRAHDPDSYALFSRVGFAIPAEVYCDPNHERFVKAPVKRPAFGGILMSQPTNPRDPKEWIPASFCYFKKVNRPSRVQAFDGDVYELTVVWDDRTGKRGAWVMAGDCHIGITGDGSTTLLREAVLVPREIKIGLRRKHHRKERITLTTTQWRYPPWILQHDTVAKDPNPTARADSFACATLRQALHTYESAIEKIVVRVSHDNCVAAFGIDVARGKYFFKDRDVTALAADGKRKRIFHAVREHTRQITATVETTVRAHYRGLRDFDWNSHHVHIVIPRLTEVLQFDHPSTYLDDVPEAERRGWMDEGVVGEKLAEVLDR